LPRKRVPYRRKALLDSHLRFWKRVDCLRVLSGLVKWVLNTGIDE
jgi:hypothetical protein